MIGYSRQKSSLITLVASPTVYTALALLVGGFFVVKIASAAIYHNYTKQLVSADTLILPSYEAAVAKRTDAVKLATTADKLAKKKMYAYAAINFKQASSVDKDYLAAAYGWGWAILQAHPQGLAAQDTQAIHDAITRAEAIDPLYPPVVKLKLALAEMEHNDTAKQLAQQRLELIGAK